MKIGENDRIVFIRTRKTEGRNNRFYVHEVFTEDEIKKLGDQQTDAAPDDTGRMYRNASEFYRNILASVMNVKAEHRENIEQTFDDAVSDADESQVAAALDAAQELRIRTLLPHNPADTAAETAKLAAEYRFRGKIETVENWSEEQLRSQMERLRKKRPDLTEDELFEYAQKEADALVDQDGTVLINVNNVRPADVRFKLSHEISGHEGLAAVFGQDGENALYDLVWQDCRNNPDFQKIMDRYHLRRKKTDEEGNPVPDEDTGEDIFEDLDREEQRLAAAEFLANLAETNGVPLAEIYLDHKAEIDAWGREHSHDPRDLRESAKDRMIKDWMADTGFKPEQPSWLKQFLAKIRLWLHQHGWVKMKHISDEQILALLANADRNVRRSSSAARRAAEGRTFKVQGSTSGEIRYSAVNAVPSKAGFTVEHVNENAGQEFNAAKGVVVQPEMIYKTEDVPAEQPQKWLRERCKEYAETHNISGEHNTPALGDGVTVTVGSVKAVLNHPGSDIKNNLIASIPDMLKDAVFIQTENNGKSKTHLLAAKVRYGENSRYIAGMVIHENQGKYYYDHELVEIEKADIQSSLPGTTGVGSESASVLNVIQDVLFSSGFDKKSSNNVKFSVNDGLTVQEQKMVDLFKPLVKRNIPDPDISHIYWAKMLEKRFGIRISAKDARFYALQALRQNRAAFSSMVMKRNIKLRDKWLMENVPMYAEIVNFTGKTDFKIKPSSRFHGE